MHGIDFLYRFSTSAMNDELLVDSVFIPDAGVCACCGRAEREWLRQEAVYYSKDRIKEIHCIPCHALFHGSTQFLGIERTIQGSDGLVEVPGKLGMLSTCALLVTRTETIIYSGEGYIKKLELAKNPFYKVQRATGFSQVMALLELNPEPPFLFISDLGRKKSELVENLKITTRHDEWNLCSAEGVSTINPQLVTELIEKIRSVEEDEKIIQAWLKAICHVSNGYIPSNDKSVEALTRKSPAFRRNVFPLLPDDPYQRIDTLRCVEHLMGYMR